MVMSKNTTGWDILNKFSIYLSGRANGTGSVGQLPQGPRRWEGGVFADGGARARLGGRRSARSARGVAQARVLM